MGAIFCPVSSFYNTSMGKQHCTYSVGCIAWKQTWKLETFFREGSSSSPQKQHQVLKSIWHSSQTPAKWLVSQSEFDPFSRNTLRKSRRATQLNCFIPIQVSWRAKPEVSCLSWQKSLVSMLYGRMGPIVVPIHSVDLKIYYRISDLSCWWC